MGSWLTPGMLLGLRARKRECFPLVETSNDFSKRLERSSGSHGVPADTWDADWTARLQKVLNSRGLDL